MLRLCSEYGARWLVEGPRNFLLIEASESAKVLHGDQGPGRLAGSQAGAAHEALSGVVAAAGEGNNVFWI